MLSSVVIKCRNPITPDRFRQRIISESPSASDGSASLRMHRRSRPPAAAPASQTVVVRVSLACGTSCRFNKADAALDSQSTRGRFQPPLGMKLVTLNQSPGRRDPYGISTLTRKNRCVALVGLVHPVSDSFSLPSTVYTRSFLAPPLFKSGDYKSIVCSRNPFGAL